MSSLPYLHRFEHGTDPSAPPLLLLHGTGGDENDLIPLGRKLSPGSTLLSPRGDVIEHGARRFFARLSEGVFDPAEVTRRTHALADFIIAAGNHYRFDPAILTPSASPTARTSPPRCSCCARKLSAAPSCCAR